MNVGPQVLEFKFYSSRGLDFFAFIEADSYPHFRPIILKVCSQFKSYFTELHLAI